MTDEFAFKSSASSGPTPAPTGTFTSTRYELWTFSAPKGDTSRLTVDSRRSNGEDMGADYRDFAITSSSLKLVARGAPSSGETCRYEPPIAYVKLNLTTGERWHDSSTCGSQAVDRTVTVGGGEEIAVGSVRLATVQLRIEQATGGSSGLVQTSTQWWSLKYGIIVKEEASVNGGSSLVRRLTSIHPM